jgi:hypothetical protein
VKAYYRAPHLLIGFPTRYIDRGWSASMRALVDVKNRKICASLNQRYGTGITEGLLMASRDGVTFKRWNEAFLKPGIERKGTCSTGNNTSAGMWSKRNPHSPVRRTNCRCMRPKIIGMAKVANFVATQFGSTVLSR